MQESKTSNNKPFKNVTEKGLEYGKNVVVMKNTTATRLRWYDDTILELYNIAVKK